MKYIISLASLLFLIFALQAQSNDHTRLSSKTKKHVRKMAKENVVVGEIVGYHGSRPELYDVYLEFKKNASTKELISLVDHKKAAVRCYAFDALLERDSIDFTSIIISNIKAPKQVNMFSGCIKETIYVADFMIYPALSKIDSNGLSRIDSALIFTPNHFVRTGNLLARIAPMEKFHARIRQMTSEKIFSTAVVTLAKYQDEDDINLINEMCVNSIEGNHYRLYSAIRHFPHPIFKWFLENGIRNYEERVKSNSQEMEMLVTAIRSYNNEWSENLLQTIE